MSGSDSWGIHQMNTQSKLKTRKFSVSIINLKDPLYKQWAWCDQSFQNNWGYECRAGPGPSSRTYSIIFYFNSEEDKVKFILKWI